MLEITSKEWHINQKSLPDKLSKEYEAYWEYQERLCNEGCWIDGVYINKYLYWHLNFWNTMVDQPKVGDELPTQVYGPPILRDNEWVIFNAIREAEKAQKGLAIGGIRRLSKTTTIASYIAHGLSFDKGSQNILAGINSDSIGVLASTINKGMNDLPEYFNWFRPLEKWDSRVEFGIRDAENRKHVFSELLVRNFNNGQNEEAIAGTKPRKLIIDEGGQGRFLRGLEAAMPGFTTPYGWTCSPIVTFTSGDMRTYHDVQKLMMNPQSYNFLEFPHESNPKIKHGLYLNRKYRMEAKEDSNLGKFLGREDSKELTGIFMQVSNEEKAHRISEEDLERKRKAGDKDTYLKELMYYPDKIEDMFQTKSRGKYNSYIIKSQIEKLRTNDVKGIPVELEYGPDGIQWKKSAKEIITEFPLKSQNKDAPICIFEFPVPNAPKFLYVAGIDTYKFDDAEESQSLGAVYIYKRMCSAVGEDFQDMFVASYVARPKDKEEWNENVRMLLKFYNAYALVENDVYDFIEYMKYRNEAEIYLAPQPQFQKTAVKKSSLSRKFGVSRSSTGVINFLDRLYGKYLDEIIDVDRDEQGNITKEYLGVSRIMDVGLLEESAQYDGIINTDRVIAAQLALALANELDPLIGNAQKRDSDPVFKALFLGERENKSRVFKAPRKRLKKNFIRKR